MLSRLTTAARAAIPAATALVASLVVGATPAMAATVATPAATTTAIQLAAQQAPANSLAALQQEAAVLQPSVDAALHAGGSAAFQQLLATQSHAVGLAVLNDSKIWQTTTSSSEPTVSDLTIEPDSIIGGGGGDGCYGSHTTTYNLGPDSSDIIAWRSIQELGWCINGADDISSWNGYAADQSITFDGTVLGFCWSGSSVTNSGWENSAHSLLHARNWQGIGPGISVIACPDVDNIDPVIRIHGNGTWDSTNDY